MILQYQCLARSTGVLIRVQIPLAIADADLEEHPRILAWHLKVEEALLRRTVAIGTEDHLPGERLHSRQRMRVKKQRVLPTVKLDRLARRRADHLRRTF